MARIDNINNFLTDVADSIRTKTGKSNKISASSFDTEIASITTSEDLDSELATYNTELTEQETSIQDIISALEGKASGGSIQPVLQDKIIKFSDIEENLIITADEGYDGLNSVKITMGESIDEYQEVSYIRTTSVTHGTNYIDTGVIPNSNTSLEMKFCYTTGAVNYSKLYGSVGTKFRAEAASQNGTKTLFFWGTSGSYKQGWDNGSLVDTVIKQAKNELYVNNVLTLTWDYTEWADTTNLRLFSVPNSDRDSLIKMYYCKIWDGDTLIRDFMPCYRKADGVIGMYDRVNNKFYKNAGSGSFAKGTDV